MGELAVIGKSVPRVDALEKVTGKAKYVVDIRVPGMLHGKILRSPYPHARIKSIDTSKALELPGVKAVLTGKDVPSKDRVIWYMGDEGALAHDVVRFVGDPVAAVAAETVEMAEEALDLIEVEYEELPAVFDVEEAVRTDPPVVVHPDLFNYKHRVPPHTRILLEPDLPNVFNHFRIRKGDVEKGFQEADLVLGNRFFAQGMYHCQMEPHCAFAQVEPDGSLTVASSTQSVSRLKGILCHYLDMPPSRLKVFALHVGGGFGGKVVPKVEPITALLALKTGRPVKIVFTREEVCVGAGIRVPMVIYIKDGVKRDGMLMAREVRLLLNSGAYSSGVFAISKHAANGAVGSYSIPHFRLDSYGVYTNEPAATALRGFGSEEVLWAIESQMDIIAEKLGVDPVELRMKNILREGERDVCGQVTHAIGARECLDWARKYIEWGKKPEEEAGPWKRGKGIALGNKQTVAGTTSSMIVKVHEDGVIEVRSSAAEIGQGVDTVLAQIAAEEFGVSMGKIKLVTRDTDVTPYEAGAFSSRATWHAGNALRLACQDAKRQLFRVAAKRLKALPENLETREGKVYVKETPEITISIGQLFMPGGLLPDGGELLGSGTFTCPVTPGDPETGQGERMVAYYSHGAYGVEVAVNVETGAVKVLRIGGAFDVGQPINPKMCEQQIDGGIGMGIGCALYEEVIVHDGVAINPSFMDYKVPSTMEIPSGSRVGTKIVSAPHRDGPFGAKGFGEGVFTPLTPAVGIAVYNAVGVRVKDLPITREKVLRGLKELKGGTLPSY